MKVGTRLGDIADLPDVLRKQIKGQRVRELEQMIITTMRKRYGSIASIEEIMVGLYRDFGYVTTDRKYMASKLYRMTRKHLKAIPKRYGIYKLKEKS